jgi:hypothetical protein
MSTHYSSKFQLTLKAKSLAVPLKTAYQMKPKQMHEIFLSLRITAFLDIIVAVSTEGN